jgi:histone-lysine N-methyltransferase SETD3
MIETVDLCEQSILNTQKLFKERRYDELAICYEQIIYFKSQSSEEYAADIYKYHANISLIFYILRDFDKAIQAAENCIALYPQWYKGYYRAAKAAEGLLDRNRAQEYYNQMICYIDLNSSQYSIEKNDSFNMDINILKEWLISNGAAIDKTKIEYYDVDYRGMCIDKPVKKDENIMQIPFDCVISLEDSKTRSYNKKLLGLGAKYNSPHTFLALELLDIKYDPSSKFRYYLSCLPKYFGNVPINFNEEKLRCLEGSFALIKIAQKKQFLLEEYNHILSLLPEFPYSYEDFVWARTCVITRVYAVERDIDGIPVKDTLLVPFADMANHVIPANTHWFFDKPMNMFIVKAAKYLANGDNLFESYGQKCNYRYFVNYGFTVEKNPFEEVAIVMNPMLSTVISQKMYLGNQQIMNFINVSTEIFQIGYDMNSEQFQKLVKFAQDKCAELLKQSDRKPTQEAVFSLISGFMQRALEGFDTTLAEDLNILKTHDLGFDIKNCIVQRIGEKKLLHHYINYFADLLKLEDIKSPKEQKKFIKKMDKKYKSPIV